MNSLKRAAYITLTALAMYSCTQTDLPQDDVKYTPSRDPCERQYEHVFETPYECGITPISPDTESTTGKSIKSLDSLLNK